jgi:glycosyltransferase involved in cell wall biosynthesis
MKASVILSTYNSIEWLEKVMVGFSVQTESDFELIIADDGSGAETKQLIDEYRLKLKFPIIHVWQEDKGFQKSQILNKAIVASTSSYLIFTDGDCIPRQDFVATHLSFQEKGYFLSGGYFKLPRQVSEVITLDDIKNQNCFSVEWLRVQNMEISSKAIKLSTNKWFAKLMNLITTTKATWNGHNSSGYKSDIVAVNGFNEDMQYGGLDRELGERLFNNGLQSKQIRYSAICVHLDHERNYMNQSSIQKNLEIRKNTVKNKITFTPNGIVKG